MKVSIITATYNSEHTIVSCIDSVLRQNYSNIEYVIIDGGSSDRTLEKINKLVPGNSQIKFQVVSETDEGIYDALNKGINFATGDIIGFVHSDDFLANENVLNDIVSGFSDCNCIDGVYGNLHYVDKNNECRIIRDWQSSDFTQKLLNKGWMPPHPTLFLKRTVYDKHGMFDLSYKISADYDFMLRVFKDNLLNFKFLPKVITKMRVGGASNRSFKNIIRKSIEDYKVIKANQIRFPISVLVKKNLSKVSQFL